MRDSLKKDITHTLKILERYLNITNLRLILGNQKLLKTFYRL